MGRVIAAFRRRRIEPLRLRWAQIGPPCGQLLIPRSTAEVDRVYRDDLGLSGKVQRCTQHLNNVWALHGLVECLKRHGESEELPALQAGLPRH